MVTIAPTRFTAADLEKLPDVPGWRYEIIDGELHVAKAVGWEHQYAADEILLALKLWVRERGTGLVMSAPGVVFADDDNVIPDVIWLSGDQVPHAADAAGHIIVAPALAVEVLSPGAANERRDRELKLDLYSRRGVREYWIVDWQRREVSLHRREGSRLSRTDTLMGEATITSPMLPGFSCPLSSLWLPVAS
ncbi:MAG: Uma2 family endonuclease [Chloroflexota bacterium]